MPDDPDQKIHLMDDVLASQVAAGEVVERPASVLKELVENSIDAGAHCIRVEVRRGGIALLKVTDDGCGMSRLDAELCLRRHATSKLRRAEDLFDIRQLGFRGEALPSIASVSRLTIRTRRAEDVEGTELICEGGEAPRVSGVGCAPGTEISMADLFYNTPVRRKFLKSEETESGHVEHQLRLHALAFPGLRFVLVKDGSLCFDLPATSDLRQRIAGFIGRELAERLMAIRPAEAPGVRVSGYLMPLSEARRNRRMQYIFLNGRPIEDKIITRAIRDGYGGFPTGLHPALFLYLEVDPGLVDVNVHPAKREVRFRRPSDITLAVLEAIGSTLAAAARGEQSLSGEKTANNKTPDDRAPDTATPDAKAPDESVPEGSAPPQPIAPGAEAQPQAAAAPLRHGPERAEVPPPGVTDAKPALTPRLVLQALAQPRQQDLKLPASPPGSGSAVPQAGAAGSAAVLPPQPPPPTVGRFSAEPDERLGGTVSPPAAHADDGGDVLPRFRYLGCLHGRYIIYENSEGLVLMNPTAARERIIFERLLESHRRPLASQRLLQPIMIEPDARDWGTVQALLPHFRQSGFSVSLFGRRTLRVEAAPALLALDDVEGFIEDLIAWFARGEGKLRRSRNPFEPFATRLAHHYALQEDLSTWLQQPMPLLVDLLRCDIPYCTPSGKPTLVPISLSELNRKFQSR